MMHNKPLGGPSQFVIRCFCDGCALCNNIAVDLKLYVKLLCQNIKLQGHQYNGLPTISEMFEQHLDIYFRLFVLLYADDTVLIAQSAEQLQSQINDFYKYCKKWNLKIHINKTNILISSKLR
jgi:hypothetical protein